MGKTAPSLYDMRNLFQVNVEEGRHLWAMVYLLQKYFGADGREEAVGLLERTSGSDEAPRMLGAFNEETPDWLSFFMFTYFTDRDGKMQLESLAQSGFDPLSRTCRFMLTEEAHHMFVGETGVGRTIERTCQAMVEAGIDDPYDIEKVRALGVIDLPTIQKKLISIIRCRWICSVRKSLPTRPTPLMPVSRAAIWKPALRMTISCIMTPTQSCRWRMARLSKRLSLLYPLSICGCAMITADAGGGVSRWNRAIAKAGVSFELKLPHVGFHRQIGLFTDQPITPNGLIISAEQWQAEKYNWLPTSDDGAFIQSLMKPCTEPGQYAGWIAAPKVGIDNKPGDFEYVQLHV